LRRRTCLWYFDKRIARDVHEIRVGFDHQWNSFKE
jgi:hypothetical protein